jgi:hypothetical protein
MRRRTGHSLGTSAVHGEVVHFETLGPWMGWYCPVWALPSSLLCQGECGGHSEINVFTHPDRVEITTLVQREVVVLS